MVRVKEKRQISGLFQNFRQESVLINYSRIIAMKVEKNEEIRKYVGVESV